MCNELINKATNQLTLMRDKIYNYKVRDKNLEVIASGRCRIQNVMYIPINACYTYIARDIDTGKGIYLKEYDIELQEVE